MNKVNYFYKGSGRGKVAGICQIKDAIPLTRNNASAYCLYNYYKYLTEFCEYDKVYIVSTVLTTDEKKCRVKNILKDLPIIFGVAEHDILTKYGINDLFMQCTYINFFGGVAQPFVPYNICRVAEWWKSSKGTDNKIFYINDDPAFPKYRIPQTFISRYFGLATGRITCKFLYKEPYTKEVLNEVIDYMMSMKDDIDECFENVIVAFCGIDYRKYVNSFRKYDQNPIGWDNFNCYIYNGVNDSLDVKLAHHPWEAKEYDCEYHGYAKFTKRVELTTNMYGALDKKFLHICGKSSFFDDLQEGVHYDIIKNIEYHDLLTYISSHAKTTYLTHDENILGNQISPRFFDCMLSDIVPLIDRRYDPNKELISDEFLRMHTFVDSPQDFAAKVKKIANNKYLYGELKYRQRMSIYKKFKDYLTPESKEKFIKFLNIEHEED